MTITALKGDCINFFIYSCFSMSIFDVHTTQTDVAEDADGEAIFNGYIYKTYNSDLKQNVLSLNFY